MFFTRRKKLVPPYERTPDDKPFQVFEILERPREEKKEYRPNRFVSPIFGMNVKDEVVIPIKTSRKRDLDKLDPFRTKPRLTREERIRKYGTAYPEFDLVRGKDLDEVMSSHGKPRQSRPDMRADIMAETPSGHDRDEDTSRKDFTAQEVSADHTSEEREKKEDIGRFFDGERPSADSFSEEKTLPKEDAGHTEERKPSPQPDDTREDESREDTSEEHAHEATRKHDETYEEEAPRTTDPESSPEESTLPPRAHEPEERGATDQTIKTGAKTYDNYKIPPVDLLNDSLEDPPDLTESIEKQKNVLNETFSEFNIGARVYHHTQGPTVTRFEIAVEKGVKLNKITNISDNIKMKLGAKEIRIEAPIPGKKIVGIEVPNEQPAKVHFRNVVNRSMFKNAAMPLTVALGMDIDGNPIYAPIKSMPHGLIAGATGSGKSVCINTILMSLLLKYKPSDLKLILIDPKMVELAPYNDIPHLITPVISDAQAATAALKWIVEEMERRFNLFSDMRARDIESYNQKIEDAREKLPYIVIVVDELADLMMISSQHVEEAIMRITQKARACGIHLIIATQRPSTDVIKGTIKSNIPTRIAFSVSSHIDSQTIIDSPGAELLLGRGDMLYMAAGQSKIRLQGAFISDDDIETVTDFIRDQATAEYIFDEKALIKNATKPFEYDELLPDVARFVVEKQEASINKISKSFSIGFNRAQSIVESLEAAEIVSGNLGSRAREVLVDEDDLDEVLKKLG